MAFWTKAFRFTAMFFVLFISTQVLTCELPNSDCSVVATLSQHRQTNTPDNHLPSEAPDNCICCCAHPLVVAPVNFVFTATVMPVPDELPVLRPISRSLDIEHPPQLS